MSEVALILVRPYLILDVLSDPSKQESSEEGTAGCPAKSQMESTHGVEDALSSVEDTFDQFQDVLKSVEEMLCQVKDALILGEGVFDLV